jgi:hypothetical protein
MRKIEELIKEYLGKNLNVDKGNRTIDCPQEEILSEYLQGALSEEKCQAFERHIADCGFCLSQLGIAFGAQQMNKQADFEPVPPRLIDKTKSLLGIKRKENKIINKIKRMKRTLFLIGAVVFFILSFFIPRYFIQFLVATLILGIRWAFESEGGRTLIMVLDSWRRHSQDKDDEISHRVNRVKNRF